MVRRSSPRALKEGVPLAVADIPAAGPENGRGRENRNPIPAR